MIVHDFNIIGISCFPHKAKTPLVIDSHRMLTAAISMQLLESVARRSVEIAQFRRTIQLTEFSASNVLDGLKSPAGLAFVKQLSLSTTKRLDHKFMLYRTTFNVNK